MQKPAAQDIFDLLGEVMGANWWGQIGATGYRME